MPTDLLASKLFIPPLRSSLVPRPRLVASLNEGLAAGHKFSLVSAPAGFGKTTLVVDWLQQTGRPVAWLSLDEADNDLARFLAYLAASFQQVDEEIGSTLVNALQSPQLPPVKMLLTALLNEIALRAAPLILVLDDYHLLTEMAVLAVVEFLLHHQPPQLHLVLMTREDPDLPLARLRAQDQLTEIRAGDLRFTQEEAELFLRGGMGLALSQEEVAALGERTEGWAAGLQLAGLSMQKQADLKAFIADFSGSHRHILDYLTGEVLEQQPEDTRAFLLQTAILDRLCGPLCEAVTRQPDSGWHLAHLESANLFVVPLDEERLWYRYHHLFADLLRSQLSRSHPEWIPELHRRASRWYEEAGDIQAAVEHAWQAADLAQAATLIEQYAIPKLYQGEVTLVIGWFDRLPEALLDSAPMLCISKAWALAVMQRDLRWDEVERALQAAQQALERVNADKALRELIAGQAASVRAFLLQSPQQVGENPQKIIDLSQEANRLLPAEEKGIRAVNAMNIGYGYLALADLEAARLAFQQTLEDGLAGGNLYAGIYGPVNQATIAFQVGRLAEALQLCDANIERFNQVLAGQNFPPLGALYVLKGSILLEGGRLAEAGEAITEGLDLIRWTGEYEGHKRGYTALARLRAIQGDRPAMLEALQTLVETWPEGAFYTQAMSHLLARQFWPADPQVRQEAQAWLNHAGIALDATAVIDGADPMAEARFETRISAARVLAHLAKGQPGLSAPGGYPLEVAQIFLLRQAESAETLGLVNWVVAVAITRALLYQAAGQQGEALDSLELALRAAEPTGLFRIFVDECESLRALLEALKPRLADQALLSYTVRLLAAMTCAPTRPEPAHQAGALLSERELEVLRGLAAGLTYEEIGQQLFVSLNTVQFHVKNIYGKLQVTRRVQALEKARELKLI